MADKNSVGLQYWQGKDMQQVQDCSSSCDLNVKTAPFDVPANEIASLLVLDDHLAALREALESESYQVALVPRHEWIQRGHLRPPSGDSALTRPSAVLLPFSWTQLVARVCEFIRDAGAVPQRRVIRFGDFSVDFTKMEVSRASGETIMLTGQEFKTLKCFLLNPGRVFSRDELLNEAWGYQHYPSTRTVDNHLFKLRQKFERDPAHPVHFLTVHAIGYKFVP
jgi:DNA-binding winged helix-turn-helix (wHTH) protein